MGDENDEAKKRAVEEWKQANGYDDLIAAYADACIAIAREVSIANALLAQRDEARELVRGALKRMSNYEFVTVDQFRAAVARWDEEEKKR